MLYLIGGASRSGKTLLAERMRAERGLSTLSLDWLVMGFTNGMPQVGIHDKLFPDDIAVRLWRFLTAMCENMLWADLDQVIEGEAMLPSRIRELTEAHPGGIRACFLGYTDVDIHAKLREIRNYSDPRTDWLAKESDAYVRDHIRNMTAFSRQLAAECEASGLPYFDTSTDFIGATEAAWRSLGDGDPAS